MESIKKNQLQVQEKTVLTDVQTPPEAPELRVVESSAEKIPNTETISINSQTFHEKSVIIQNIKDDYSRDKRLNQNIKLQKAIKLIHPKYKDTEIEPLSFSSGTRSTLERWFQNNLPKYGINNISEIDYNSILPFLIANPKIVPLFDDQASETKLGESSFRMITISFPGEHFFEIQKLISEFLIQIPMENRPNDETTKKFLGNCQKILTLQTKEKDTKRQIEEIYRKIV